VGRRRETITSPELSRLGLGARRDILQRTLLEAVALDSDAYRRHSERLRKVTVRGGDEAEHVAAYERTIEELGLTARYAELVQRRQVSGRWAAR
jgi:hypothetical protein